MKLLESWAKSPFLNNADVLIVSECLQTAYPDVFSKFSKGRIVLTTCPETEQPVFGKLASMLTSTKPKSITVLTVECSPHCYGLHAAVNEAYYIAKISEKEIPKEHYVCINGEAKKISKEAIRVARYLHIVEELVKQNPDIIGELEKYSLEQKCNK